MEYLGSKRFVGFFAAILITISAFVFQNPNNQSINWTFPYFSGAANFSRLFDWQISPSDYEIAAKLSSQDYRRYKHQRTRNTVKENYNNYGYVFVVIVATRLFPFLGDIQSVILLQVIVHLGISLFMIVLFLRSPFQRYGFLFLYAANPLVMHFVTFPYYYFWMFIPSTCFIIWWTRSDWRIYSLPAMLPLLLFSLLIRPTTVFLCALIYLAAAFYATSSWERIVAIASGFAFIVGVFLISGTDGRSPAHAMYIGLGAYPNNVGVKKLSDDEGYRFFCSKTGVTIDTNAVRGNFRDPAFRSQYMDTLMNRYKEIVLENPLQIARNALLNTLQTFSVGHNADRKWINYLSSLVGATVITFFICTGQWVFLFGIFFSALGYTWYFPPIPAYNFGAYPLLVVGFLSGVEQQIRKSRKAFASEKYPLWR